MKQITTHDPFVIIRRWWFRICELTDWPKFAKSRQPGRVLRLLTNYDTKKLTNNNLPRGTRAAVRLLLYYSNSMVATKWHTTHYQYEVEWPLYSNRSILHRHIFENYSFSSDHFFFYEPASFFSRVDAGCPMYDSLCNITILSIDWYDFEYLGCMLLFY